MESLKIYMNYYKTTKYMVSVNENCTSSGVTVLLVGVSSVRENYTNRTFQYPRKDTEGVGNSIRVRRGIQSQKGEYTLVNHRATDPQACKALSLAWASSKAL